MWYYTRYNLIRSKEDGRRQRTEERRAAKTEAETEAQAQEETETEEEAKAKSVMTINAIILLILIIVLNTKGDKRSAVLIFIWPALLFQVANFAGIIPGDYFHLIGGVLDAVIVSMLVRWTRPGFTPVFLGLISVVSIFANVSGWMRYEAELNALMYDSVYVSVYSLVLVVSLMEWSSGARADCHNSRFRGSWI